MAIPFDADWRRVAASPDTTIALARWAKTEPSLAGADLDTLRRRAASRDIAQSDSTLAALLRLAGADLLARRTILEALMARLVPIAAALARRTGDEYDDVLAEVAGWAWELTATIPADRWTVLLAPNLARLARRRYLTARPPSRAWRHRTAGNRRRPRRATQRLRGQPPPQACRRRRHHHRLRRPRLEDPRGHRRHRPGHRRQHRTHRSGNTEGTRTSRCPTAHLPMDARPTRRMIRSTPRHDPPSGGLPPGGPPGRHAVSCPDCRPPRCSPQGARCEPPLRSGTRLLTHPLALRFCARRLPFPSTRTPTRKDTP
jgi:hypothetical protein